MGPSLKRVDLYHLDSLSPERSIKRRGDTQRLECKARSQVVPVTVGATHGVAERWQKLQPREPQALELDGPWLEVGKQIWSFRGIEIVRIVIGERRWWSVAFAVVAVDRASNDLALPWIERFDDTSVPGGYASWLAERRTRA